MIELAIMVAIIVTSLSIGILILFKRRIRDKPIIAIFVISFIATYVYMEDNLCSFDDVWFPVQCKYRE